MSKYYKETGKSIQNSFRKIFKKQNAIYAPNLMTDGKLQHSLWNPKMSHHTIVPVFTKSQTHSLENGPKLGNLFICLFSISLFHVPLLSAPMPSISFNTHQITNCHSMLFISIAQI